MKYTYKPENTDGIDYLLLLEDGREIFRSRNLNDFAKKLDEMDIEVGKEPGECIVAREEFSSSFSELD